LEGSLISGLLRGVKLLLTTIRRLLLLLLLLILLRREHTQLLLLLWLTKLLLSPSQLRKLHTTTKGKIRRAQRETRRSSPSS
jgi:hypothetical protein